jgi:hypothetical protein
MIPNKSSPEWKMLITGAITHNFSSFSLQMTVSRLRISCEMNRLTMDEAVDELYIMCNKYKLAVQKDIDIIFNNHHDEKSE